MFYAYPLSLDSFLEFKYLPYKIPSEFLSFIINFQAQAEYMDAQARNDVAKMRELQLRFKTQRRTDRR